MVSEPLAYEIRLARDARDLKASQRLRYEVFVEELGGVLHGRPVRLAAHDHPDPDLGHASCLLRGRAGPGPAEERL